MKSMKQTRRISSRKKQGTNELEDLGNEQVSMHTSGGDSNKNNKPENRCERNKK